MVAIVLSKYYEIKRAPKRASAAEKKMQLYLGRTMVIRKPTYLS